MYWIVLLMTCSYMIKAQKKHAIMCLIICICVVKMESVFTLESFKFAQYVDFVGYNTQFYRIKGGGTAG